MNDSQEHYLKNRKILFFAPAFFNYEYIIKEKMEHAGAAVYFYDARSVSKAWERAILKVSPLFFLRKSDNYFGKIISKHKHENFDYIFIVKCDMFSKKILKRLKTTFPKAKLCLHIWDSIKNIPNILNKVDLFNFASSFDRNDCLKNNKFAFRPLFYADEFNKSIVMHKEYSYDVSFCGTIHSDRYGIIKKIIKQCNNFGFSFYNFCFLQSKFIYYFYKLINPDFWNSTLEDFSFDKKTQKEISEISDSSRIILDIQHPNQTGLTMRTIEMIGLKKKIITTNTDIVNYDFYRSENICVIDRKNPVIDTNFLNTEYLELPKEIYEKYSLDNWILDVLDIKRQKA